MYFRTMSKCVSVGGRADGQTWLSPSFPAWKGRTSQSLKAVALGSHSPALELEFHHFVLCDLAKVTYFSPILDQPEGFVTDGFWVNKG